MGGCESCEDREGRVAPEAVTVSSLAPAPVLDAPRLSVTIGGVRGLRSSDWLPRKGTSACFCVLRAGVGELHRTRAVLDALEPSWGEAASLEQLPGQALEFLVWDRDQAGSCALLGTAALEPGMLEPVGFSGELRLEGAQHGVAPLLRVRAGLQGRERAPEPASQFRACLERAPGAPLGLDLDTQDGATAYVVGLARGAVQAYNEDVKPAERLRPGDFIVRANGVDGRAAEMAERIQRDTKLELLVRRPQEFSVAIERTGPTKAIGAELPRWPVGSSLLILRLLDGPFKDWNAASPGREVRRGDRIVAVGGRRGRAADLLRWMKASESCQVTVARPAQPEHLH